MGDDFLADGGFGDGAATAPVAFVGIDLIEQHEVFEFDADALPIFGVILGFGDGAEGDRAAWVGPLDDAGGIVWPF